MCGSCHRRNRSDHCMTGSRYGYCHRRTAVRRYTALVRARWPRQVRQYHRSNGAVGMCHGAVPTRTLMRGAFSILSGKNVACQRLSTWSSRLGDDGEVRVCRGMDPTALVQVRPDHEQFITNGLFDNSGRRVLAYTAPASVGCCNNCDNSLSHGLFPWIR